MIKNKKDEIDKIQILTHKDLNSLDISSTLIFKKKIEKEGKGDWEQNKTSRKRLYIDYFVEEQKNYFRRDCEFFINSKNSKNGNDEDKDDVKSYIEQMETTIKLYIELSKIRSKNVIPLKKYFYDVSDNKERGIIKLYTPYINCYSLGKYTGMYRGFCEFQARKIFLQVVNGLFDIHSLGFSHGDMKVSNCIIDKNEKVYIIDLESVSEKKYTRLPMYYTMKYRAPECDVLHHKWTHGENGSTFQQNCSWHDPKKNDIFSLGYILLSLLTGNEVERYFIKNFEENERETFPQYRLLSKEVKDLLKSIFEKEKDKRITLLEIKNHKWMKMNLIDYTGFIHQKYPTLDIPKISNNTLFIKINDDDIEDDVLQEIDDVRKVFQENFEMIKTNKDFKRILFQKIEGNFLAIDIIDEVNNIWIDVMNEKLSKNKKEFSKKENSFRIQLKRCKIVICLMFVLLLISIVLLLGCRLKD